MTTPTNADAVSYEQFCQEWLAEIEEPGLLPLDKGRIFATKLITQWLGVTSDDDDFVICDGARDGGIDVAYLKRADADTGSRDDNTEDGDTWYLFQSKYGTAFSGTNTILEEGNKVIATLLGQNPRLQENSRQLVQKLDSFRQQDREPSNADRIVLVFATTSPVSQQDRQALDDIKLIGRERVFRNFDVEEISLQTIWETLDNAKQPRLSVAIDGQFVEQASGLLVGTVSLTALFEFLQAYRKQTGNLAQLYEKNVRQFLGSRRKINKGIADTLNKEPEKFGLYNNGITIVASGYNFSPDIGGVTMEGPYVVNGCQTTRTIWVVLDGKLNTGGTGNAPSDDDWRERVGLGGLVTKIVRSDEAEITKITRYTNSQNSVREQDFIALDSDFLHWKFVMERDYKIFLEIQRGGTDSRKAYEKQHPDLPRFDDYVNAFDLIKVYGAGWLAVPGVAYGKNPPFLPGGSVYERMVSRTDEVPFGARDLYAAYKIKSVADRIGFGRTANQGSRRQSRFLFYYIIMKMLGNVIRLTPELNQPAVLASHLTHAVLQLSTPDAENQLGQLADGAANLIDAYLTAGGSGNTAFNEAAYLTVHNGDLNGFLKADKLGSDDHSPMLEQLLAITNMAFGMTTPGMPSGRELVAKALIGNSG